VIYSFAFSGGDIGRLSYVQNGSWTTAATSVGLDHIKLIEFVPGGTLYDAYASTYPWLGVLGRSATDDPDLDGMSNFMEFAFGLQPTVPDANPVEVTANAGTPAIRFMPLRDTSAVQYAVQFSDDLSDWESTPEVIINTAAGVMVEEDLPTGAKGFGRVAVSAP
jgi:hypothetical protein